MKLIERYCGGLEWCRWRLRYSVHSTSYYDYCILNIKTTLKTNPFVTTYRILFCLCEPQVGRVGCESVSAIYGVD